MHNAQRAASSTRWRLPSMAFALAIVVLLLAYQPEIARCWVAWRIREFAGGRVPLSNCAVVKRLVQRLLIESKMTRCALLGDNSAWWAFTSSAGKGRVVVVEISNEAPSSSRIGLYWFGWDGSFLGARCFATAGTTMALDVCLEDNLSLKLPIIELRVERGLDEKTGATMMFALRGADCIEVRCEDTRGQSMRRVSWVDWEERVWDTDSLRVALRSTDPVEVLAALFYLGGVDYGGCGEVTAHRNNTEVRRDLAILLTSPLLWIREASAVVSALPERDEWPSFEFVPSVPAQSTPQRGDKR